MNEHTGRLQKLGNWRKDSQYIRYSYIKISDRVLKDVRVPVPLDDLLRTQLIHRGETKLWVSYRPRGLLVQAVTIADGRTFRRSSKHAITSMIIAFFLATIFAAVGARLSDGCLLQYIVLGLGAAALMLGVYGVVFIKRIQSLRANMVF